MITNLDHLGIIVKNVEKALKLYRDQLGLKVTHTEVIERDKVKIAFLPLGDTDLELLEPTDGKLRKYLDEKGEGLHHIALKVTNIEELLQKMKENGVRLIDEKPRPGGRGTSIAFIHPKSTMGVLIELVEDPR